MTLMEPEREHGLVARLRARDGTAFDEVYAAFHVRLFSFLARLSRNRDVAEDLAEETWLRLVAHAPRLRPETRLGPWLFSVGRNLYVSYCRSRQIDYDARAGLHLWPTPPVSATPFESASATELQRHVEAALATLPPLYREALLLVAFEGCTPSEAAEICQVSAETMRQRLSRGRAMLARRLDASNATLGLPHMKEAMR
jgi:RNA polymerase sigma-70 factor (ECF subfamily)